MIVVESCQKGLLKGFGRMRGGGCGTSKVIRGGEVLAFIDVLSTLLHVLNG